MDVPLLWVAKRLRRRWRGVQTRRNGPAALRAALTQPGPKRIVIGADGKFDRGWIPTDKETLDLLKPESWARYFPPESIDAFLAEHVWEHLSEADGLTAARTCYTYLKPGGYLRLAVPDGQHPGQEYIDWSRVGGRSPGQLTNDHKALYTFRTFSDLLTKAGFEVTLYEYWDYQRQFCFAEWSTERGTIWRSKRYDPRNQDGELRYTSIVADAVKPQHEGLT